MMQKIQIKRTKNLWVPLKGNFCTPCAVWELDIEQLEILIDTDVRKQIVSCFANPESLEHEAELKITDLLAFIAAKLQSCDSDEVFHWFIDVGSRHSDPRFCYPFLDEIAADLVGPLAINFLLNANELWSGGKDLNRAKIQTLRILLEARKQIDRIQAYLQILKLLIHAKERCIPTRRHAHKRIYQLGYGAQKSLIANGFTDHTSRLASDIAQDKYVAASVMREASLPAPKHYIARTIEEAKKASKQIGFPLVVKPRSKGKGVGVSVGVTDNFELESAWLKASRHGDVLIEEMLEGLDHRLHVVDGNCFYVIRRSPPYIVGDGISTVEKLFDEYKLKRSADPKYSKYPNADLVDPIVREYLKKQNLTVSSIPELNEVIYLRSNSNVSTGGFMDDVTAQCHPDNKLLAERVARATGLDNAGVDLITTDITKSWMDVGGGICEVNATPGFISDDGFYAVLDYLFPKGRTGRIPIILMVGEPHAVQDFCDLLTKMFIKNHLKYGYIFNKKLCVFSVNGTFVTPGKRTQDLLTGLLTDGLVENAFIQLGFEEIEAGLNLQYIDLIVAVGTESEISLIQQSDLNMRCNQANVLINPTINTFENAIKDLLK